MLNQTGATLPIPPTLTVGGFIALLEAAAHLLSAAADGVAALSGQTPERVRALPIAAALGAVNEVLQAATPPASPPPAP